MSEKTIMSFLHVLLMGVSYYFVTSGMVEGVDMIRFIFIYSIISTGTSAIQDRTRNKRKE